MTNFESLQGVFTLVNTAEDNLKSLRDNVDSPTQVAINKALKVVIDLRTQLWGIDNALAKGKGV